MKVIAAAGAVILAIAAAYATAFGAAFQYDDAHNVVANPAVQSWGAWLASLPAIRALTKASYVAGRVLSPQPWSQVLLSVAMHAIAALAVLALARRWLADLAPRAPALAAPLVALLFALHPAQTEAVTYVSGRSVVLAGALYLVALLAWERHRETGRTSALATSLAAFALALAARETAWTLPFAIVLVEAARGRTWRAAFGAARTHLLLLGVAALVVAASPTYRWLLRESFATRGPVDNLVAQVNGIAYLVTHPLATLRVNFDPDVALPAPPDVAWAVAATLLVAALALGFVMLRRCPWLGLAVLWFFLHLAPTNGLVARYDLVNDRQLYLALVGPAFALGVALARGRRGRALGVALCVVLGTATLVRNTDYHSERALWAATVRASPQKSRTWNNLGWSLQHDGDLRGARAAYERALALDPRNFRARANLDALPAR